MTDFISNLIGNEYLATLIMSLIPLIELKGAIIYAWDILGFIKAFLLSYLGSTLVVVPIFFLLKPILNLLKKVKFFNKFALKIEGYFSKKAQETLKSRQEKNGDRFKRETFIKCLGVFIFVAIPLPMTGVWTGTAIAVFLGLKFKEAVLPIVIGNFVAGLLVSGLSALCTLLSINLDIVLWILFALAGVLLIFTFIKIGRAKPQEENITDNTKINE
jgi:uncharacterized membrane protein